MDWKRFLVAVGAALGLYAVISGVYVLIFVLVKFAPWMLPILVFLLIVAMLYSILEDFKGKS